MAKEKNKKEGGLGMSKKKMLGLALGTVGLMGLVYSYVQAGSLTDNGKTSYTPATVAKELVDAGNVTVSATQIELDNKVYKPTDIPLGSLIGPTISISVDKGKINVGSAGVAICNATDNATIANYQTGSGTNQLVFSSSNSTISNNISYWIGNSTCNGTAGLTFEIPQGSSSVTMTIKTGSATTQQVVDTASATIISVVPQFSASVNSKFSAKIDYASGFKTFENNATSDNGTINLISNKLNVSVQDKASSNDTTFSVTLKPTDMSGIQTVTINSINCPKLTDQFVCNATYDITTGNNTFTINATVTGTDVLAERSFTVDALLDFTASNVKDQILLTNADFGAWIYKGTAIYVPLIGVNPTTGRETYIKLQSKDTNPNANKVKAIILASDGSLVTADLGQITPGQPFTIKGSDLAAKVQAAGKTVGDSFAAILVVSTDEANLFGYANIIDPSGAKRVPLKTRDGKIVE
jgi:hypothetical protein